jgi:hypothetical protein
VLVSTETPFDGFHEVGQFTLVREPREQAFPINQRARFVKLRILENFGGKRTSLGEVKLIEGSAPGYVSILLAPEATTASRAAISVVSVDETGIAVETEPNNTPAEANPLALGLRTKGMIDPIGEKDHFKLSIPGAASSVLTLELLGRPYIRASLTLLDGRQCAQGIRPEPGNRPSRGVLVGGEARRLLGAAYRTADFHCPDLGHQRQHG